MSPGSSTESYPTFAHIGLRENPGKNLNQITCPDWDLNPGHLVSQPDALTVTPQVWTFGYLTTLNQLLDHLASMEVVIARWYLARCGQGFVMDYLTFGLRLRKTEEKPNQLVQVKSASGNIGMECRGKTQLPHRSLDAQISTCAHRLKYTKERTHFLSLSSDIDNLSPHATFSPTPMLANQSAKPHCQAEVLLSKNLNVRIYKTVILPVVLSGCETWTLTLREEHRLRVFENKVLRKISGAKRDEVTGEWRKLHNIELHALYSSPDIIRNIKSRRLRWAGHVARMDESRNAYRVLVGRPEGQRPLGRPRRRWEDNIKMEVREVGYDDRD
ncbi:hypothetical protein ANN_20980 [Periplaneta americana]|uniref:Uncharacterized protein n=1 Tax=Periplaneta americana TaxID=6978 RepID=A0ABQ8SEY6_PERAM|nr:hypothetical protein ANN_20980 [Periplaneta americana]